MNKLVVALTLSSAVLLAACPEPTQPCKDCLGCCDADGRCQQGISAQACGQAGAACQVCSATQSCVLSSCVATATGGGGGATGGGGGATGGGGGTCDGCLFNGTCIPRVNSNNDTLCGQGGVTCASCSAAEHCVDYACTATGTGGGGAVTGGGGGAATGGGGAVTGGGGGAATGGGGGAVTGGGGGAVTGGGGGAVTGGGGGAVTGGGGGAVTGGGGGTVDAGIDAGPMCVPTGQACGASADCCTTWCSPTTGSCATPPAGETCGNAIPLTFTNNVATVSGTTATATEDITLSCGGITRDVFYRFTTTTVRRVKVHVSTFAVGFSPVVALMPTGCGREYTCTPAGDYGIAPYLQPGTYVVVVKGLVGSGTFSLDVTLEAPLAGETCEAPMSITPDNTGSAFLSYSWSSYVGYGGDYAVGCHLPGPTHVSSFTLQNRALVWFSYDDSTTKMRVAVVGPTTAAACATGPLVACSTAVNQYASTSWENRFHRVLEPGTYFIFTRNELASSGQTYGTLRVSTGPVGESCQNPALFPADGGRVTGTTAGKLNDSADCSAAGRDTQHLLDLAERSYVDVTVTPNTAWAPTVALKGFLIQCAGSTACFPAVDAGVPLRLPRQTLSEGAWGITIDGLTATDFGPYTLDVDVTPLSRRQGDVCLNPIPLTLVNDTVTVNGTTAGWSNDYRPTCATGDGFGDVVYSLTLTTPRRITVSISESTDLDAVITLSTTCSGEDLGCQSSGSVSTAGVVPAGTYFIRVDGSRFASWAADGPYSLTVTVQ